MEQRITSETENIREHTVYDAPKNSKFKSYMGYEAITNKNSRQYKLQIKAYTDEHGIRVVDGRLCIAVGSYYSAKIGTHIDLIMKNGAVIECILADCKADVHTDSKNQQDINNNSVVKFVVDTALLNVNTKKMGDMSYLLLKEAQALMAVRESRRLIFGVDYQKRGGGTFKNMY